MPIPGPGQSLPITTIATEFGGTVPHEISEYYRGGALVPNSPSTATIPTSGTIAFSNFYNTSATSRVAVPLVISASTDNYDVYTNRGPTYVPGSSDITVTVNPGVTVGSSSTAAYAMLVPSCFSPADTITIVNNGVVQGKGGAGGTGQPGVGGSGIPGFAGGNAIFVNRPTVITNNGTVASGGGGGGGGGTAFTPRPTKSGGPRTAYGGGGGGGAGAPPSAGGIRSTAPAPGTLATPGNPGTSPAGGSGGAGGTSLPAVAVGGPGGAGGGRGAAGSNGTPAPSPVTGAAGSGGAAGNYIVGNPFVTWPVTGTRQGGVA